ncbi:MAG: AraC family transcriptional regulator [Polyangiales bacterium]
MGVRSDPTVSLALMRGLLCAADQRGVAPAAVLEGAGVHPEELELPDARISRAGFERACAVAIQLTGDDALGLHWAERSLYGSFGPISVGLAHAASLRKAFQILVRFERFFTNTASHQLIEAPHETSLRLPCRGGSPLAVRRLWSELNTAWFIKLLRSMHEALPLTRVDFVHEAPPYRDAYARVFGESVRFARPFNEIVFPSRLLDAAVSDVPPPRSASLTSGSRAPAPPCSQRLHQLLLQRAPSRLDMSAAARALGYGERSLRRHLAAEGRTYKEVEFAALGEVAKHLLLDGERSIQETAHEMGFTSLSAFHRAFKRWTGTSPKNVQVHARTAARF